MQNLKDEILNHSQITDLLLFAEEITKNVDKFKDDLANGIYSNMIDVTATIEEWYLTWPKLIQEIRLFP